MDAAMQRVHQALQSTTLDCPVTIITLARFLAKKAIKRQMQMQKVKLSHVRAAVINEAAREYLQEHPELIEEAIELIRTHPPMHAIAEQEQQRRARAKLSSNAQKRRA